MREEAQVRVYKGARPEERAFGDGRLLLESRVAFRTASLDNEMCIFSYCTALCFNLLIIEIHRNSLKFLGSKKKITDLFSRVPVPFLFRSSKTRMQINLHSSPMSPTDASEAKNS